MKKMKNKLIVGILLILLFSYFISSQEKPDISTLEKTNQENSKAINTITADNSGFEEFLTKNQGKDISVTINNLDVTIVGTLVAVYKDSLIIKTLFNKQVLILKNSIAYIKIGIDKK
jgi:hypothetical protein